MNEIGQMLKNSRKKSGVSIKEASEDLDIKEVILENIEDGNIGCFKDIFILKDYIHDYAKYLGLNPDKIIDEFNEYLFEYTSKIPVNEIEKAIKEKTAAELKEEKPKVVSPYTMPRSKKTKKINYILIGALVLFLIVVVVIWSVKQITINNEVANKISSIE